MFVKLRAEKGPVPLGVIAQLELTYEDGSKEILGTDDINLVCGQDASEAIAKIDEAIKMVSDVRAKLGA